MGLLGFMAKPSPPAPPALRVIVDPEPASVPYLHGAGNTYNPALPILADHVTTADGSVAHSTAGSYVHPSVLDFHALTPSGKFAGHRYWMANSEYSKAGNEDTMILRSDDGYEWRQPTGAKPGPLWRISDHPEQAPSGSGINTDNELAYDAATSTLYVYWRQDITEGWCWMSKTTDGITWTLPRRILTADRMTTVSMSIVPDGSGGWWMFCWGNRPSRRSASSLEGPWGEPVTVAGLTGWHGGVWRNPASGVLYAVSQENWTLTAKRSTDNGLTWKAMGLILAPKTDGWDALGAYRPTIQPHPNGTHFRVWYSTYGLPGADNRTGYTVIPRAMWGD